MNNFTFQYPVRQHFGKGCAESAIKEEMNHTGTNVLLAYGGSSLKRTGLYDKIQGWLHECGKNVFDFGGIMPNPTYAMVQEGAKMVRQHNIDFILAVGGGSVIDCCKIVAAQAKLDADIWEMQYANHLFPTEFLPMAAVVTASGTGAEQNNGAVITNTEKKLKQPLVGAYNSFAILDCELTKTVPMKQVVSGAFDTLSHCMETYMGKPMADNISDEINEAVMRNVINNLRAIIADPDNDYARGELMWASAMAENSLLKLGKQTYFQCHMLEHAVAAYTNCNHGQGLAVIHSAVPPHAGRRKRETGTYGRAGLERGRQHYRTDGCPRHKRARGIHQGDWDANPLGGTGHNRRESATRGRRHMLADARLLQTVFKRRAV